MGRNTQADLNDYWALVRRQRRIVGLCFLLAVSFAFAINTLSQPTYRATSQILILQEPLRSPVTGEILESRNTYAESLALETAAALIANRTLMAQVLTVLRDRWGIERLDEPPSFLQHLIAEIRHLFQPFLGQPTSSSTDAPSATTTSSDPNDSIDLLLDMITIRQVRNTRLVNIHVDHPEAVVAQRIANTTAQLFIEYQAEQRGQIDRQVATYLTHELSQLKATIEDSERVFYSFKERENLFSLDAKIKEKVESISGLNAVLTKANTERLAVIATLTQLKSLRRGDIQDSGELPIQSETLEALRRHLAAANTDLAKSRETYKSQHPKIKTLESVVESIQRNIRKELDNHISHLEGEQAILKSREDQLKAAIAQTERTLHEINRKALQYSILERDFNTNRDLYNLLLTKLKEVDVTGKVRGPLIELIEPATVPKEPIRPMKVLNVALSISLGLLTGFGLAFWREFLRRTIRTPRDVATHLQLRALGMIPKRP
jgi:uncharacterized protein involved in exopolysaccharide biosynthesis